MLSSSLSSLVGQELSERLQRRALVVFLPVSMLIGAVVLTLSSIHSFALQVEGLAFLMLVLPLCLWGILGTWRIQGAWITVFCYLCISMMVVYMFEPVGVFALIVPVGLAWLLLGPIHGLLLTLALSAFLAVAPQLALTGFVIRTVALATLWFLQFVAWPLLVHAIEAMEAAHEGYTSMRSLLEEARDQRVLLRQTQEDLLQANTELSRVLGRLDAMRQVAEDARRTKEEFVANVSHELRTPLNMIIGFTEMITDMPSAYGDGIPTALLADLDVIARNSQHLSSMIDDILDLSQVEAGRWALMRERVALSEILEAAFMAVRPLFNSKGLYLTGEVQENLPPILCDRTRIREVLLNLLSNAGRATEKGGVRVAVHQEGEYALIEVSDTGPGISVEHQERIFRPFEQVDGSIRRLHGGSGLGLTISRAFVELHGGRMWLKSELGQGTSFFFRLPIDPPNTLETGLNRWFSPYLAYEPRQRVGRAPIVAPRPRFVVLEDEDALAHLLGRYMNDAEVVPARTWEKAMEELGKTPAQALLVNQLAPLEAWPVDRSSSLPFGTPAIICSFPLLQETIQAYGASDYLVKPISRQDLLQALEDLDRAAETVLIVDDEPEALRLFQRMLHSAERPYRVLTATNGEEALKLIQQDRPDAILLDLVMPEMDGYRFLELRKEDPDLCRIPVIIISARDPSGQPIISNAFGLVCGGGLSVAQLLAFIENVTTIVGPEQRSPSPELLETQSD